MTSTFDGDPVFARRAYMLDVSRDRVPTRETVAWLIDVLAELRFNELQLYVEHTFTYTGHETVWRDASPLTHEDVKWIGDRARERGIGLVANMNGFGHMGRWLRHDEYRHLAECPDGAPSLLGRGQMDPTCLEPTPANAAFAVSLAREMLDAVGGRTIHIGGDEPFELGDGRSYGRAEERGRDHVYLEHLRRIIEPLVDDGAEVLFWADMFRRDAQLMASIPAGATGVVWHYEAPSEESWFDLLPAQLIARLGLPEDSKQGFEAHARLFVEAGAPFWVAPGTGTWNTFIGRNRNAADNIVDAAVVGARHGAGGFLLTDWGDNGHWQPLAVSLPSMARAAAAAWRGGPSDVDVGSMIDGLLGAEPGTGQLIDDLGGLGESLGSMAYNGSPVFTVLVSTGMPTLGDLDEDAAAEALRTLDVAADVFRGNPIPGERGEIIADEMLAVCRLAELGLRRLRRQDVSSAEIDAALRAQEAAWLRSSRPGGLSDSIGKLRSPR